MSLSRWQSYLNDHFKRLRARRPTGRPIFALEHGLAAPELDDLDDEVRAEIAGRSPSRENSLPWIVYASELGYRYAGDEYWQTFEECTPGWADHGDRHWIRTAFQDFYENYGGARPSGLWAEHFSIICWPITHAILPRDLQRQLARILYELRHGFQADMFESPHLLGERIAAASWRASSRFQNFAQEPALVGQIAAALLFHDDLLAAELILPATLERIASDLDQERRTRTWLHGAKTSARLVQLHGLRRGGSQTVGPESTRDRQREQVSELALEPRVVLRPTSSSSWEVLLQIPDLSPLLARFPALREILTGSRCRVTGAASRAPMARGKVLHGSNQVLLQEWPRPDEILIRFDHSSPEIEGLLSTSCLLRPGPIWLFRIQVDGLAYEVRGKVVRPGASYVLMSSNGPIQADGSGSPAQIDCAGLTALRFDLPDVVSRERQEGIESLGLALGRAVRVWPAGVPAAAWDGEGHSEWIFSHSDRLRLAIAADHSVDSLTVRVLGDEQQTLELKMGEIGEPMFVELPLMPPGKHIVRVTARSGGAQPALEVGELTAVIREPRPWAPGVGDQSPFTVVIDPATPSLDDLWEGGVEVEVQGPEGRVVECTLSLFERGADAPYLVQKLPGMRLPVDPETWESRFDGQFRDVERVRNLYDRAQSCKIEFDAGELGIYSVGCEREFTPVRWIVQKHGSRYSLNIVDDTDRQELVEISRYGFEHPEQCDRVCSPSAGDQIEVPESGGMYVARAGSFGRVVVLPPEVHGLEDLSTHGEVRSLTRSPLEITECLSVIELWSAARIPGNLAASVFRRRAVETLLRSILETISGDRWARVEAARAAGSENWIDSMVELIPGRRYGNTLAGRLKQDYPSLAGEPIQRRIADVQELAKSSLLLPASRPSAKGTIMSVAWLVEFALRLASCPDNVRTWAGANLTQGIELVLETPALARAARFLVLAVDDYLGSQPFSERVLYRGWVWE